MVETASLVSFPVMRRGRELGRVRHCGASVGWLRLVAVDVGGALPCEALERRGLRVDAERDPRRLQLFCYELVYLLFDLVHGGELALPGVVEGVRRGGLQVGRVVPRGRRRAVAALAHTRVVAEPALLQVRVRQGVNHRYTLHRVEY